MLVRVLTVSIFLSIIGLLTAQRFFAMPPQMTVTVRDVQGESAWSVGDEMNRGEIIATGEEYLRLRIGEVADIWLARQTTLELRRLFEDELSVLLTRGRMLVSHHGQIPLRVQTNHTSHAVLGDVVSFVNYDFLETIHVIPLSGSVQVFVEGTGEGLLTPLPLSIHETDPVSYGTLEVNLSAGDAAEFYRWAGVLTP